MSSQILGVVGTALVIVGYVPQVFHMVKERCTAGISIPAFALWCSASLLFLIHATMIEDAVFVGVQIVNLLASGFIVWFSKKHEGEVCPSHRQSVLPSARTGREATCRQPRVSSQAAAGPGPDVLA